MLDKSIPYKNIIMKMDEETVKTISDSLLPKGFSFRFFEEGDEEHWARIETSVSEFDTESSAKNYFEKEYLLNIQELKRRCIFVLSPDGLPIATAMAWFSNSNLGYQRVLHWVAVCPEYQGRGLGKAVVQKAICIFNEVDYGKDVLLHTQTWSHMAVRLYYAMGFHMMKQQKIVSEAPSGEGIKVFSNDYDEAIEILADIVDSTFLNELMDTAE